MLQIKTKIVSCHTANSKRVKPEVNSTVILPRLVFSGYSEQVTFEKIFIFVADTLDNKASVFGAVRHDIAKALSSDICATHVQ